MNRLTPWIFIFVGLYAVGQVSPMYGIDSETTCLQAQLQHNAPAPDILIIGNSSIGAAVDTAFMEEEFARKTDRAIKVERLINLGPNIFKYQLDLKAYAEKRGWPDIVLLNLFIDIKKPSDYSNQPIFEIKSLKLHDWQSLREVNNDFLDHYRGARLQRILNASWYSDVELLLFKATDSVYRSIKLLSSTILPRHFCGEASGFTGKPKYLPHNRLKAGAIYDEINGLITPHPGNLKANQKEAAGYYPPRLDSRDRYMEFHQMQKVISLAQDQDVRFFVTHVPILDWRDLGPNSQEMMAKLIPDATFVDSYQMYEIPGAEQYSGNAFRNVNHLNFNGAHLFSSFWINHLSEQLDD